MPDASSRGTNDVTLAVVDPGPGYLLVDGLVGGRDDMLERTLELLR